MRILRSIVAPLATLVAFCDSKMTGCGGIRSQLICNELIWAKAIFLQQLAHQFKRRPFVPPSLDQHVEDLAFGVDGAPKVDHPAIDFQIDFVQMPSRVGFGSAFAQVRRDHWPEMVHPAPDGLIGIVLSIEAKVRRAGKGKRLVIGNGAETEVNAGLVELIKEAFAIRNQFLSGSHDNIEAMSGRLGMNKGRLTSLVRLSYLGPEIVQALLAGSQSPHQIPKHGI